MERGTWGKRGETSGKGRSMAEAFNGAKAAAFIGEDLLVYQRDATPGLAYAGMWDFPGGGREGAETPEQTLIREVEEEFGLRLTPDDLGWRRAFRDGPDPADVFWFFVVRLPADAVQGIVFGDEGQRWRLMRPADYLRRDDIIPKFRDRLAVWARDTRTAL